MATSGVVIARRALTTWALLPGALAFGLLGALVVGMQQDADEAAAVAVGDPAPRLALWDQAGFANSAAPPPAALPRPIAAAPTAPLVDLLAAPATQLRASLQSALAQTGQGGRLYARSLARQCAELERLLAPPLPGAPGPEPAAGPDVNQPTYQRALARQAALATGCGQLLTHEWLALASVPAHEALPNDPLLGLLESPDDAARLAATLAHPDPLLLDELGSRLLAGHPFDGETFQDEEAGRRLDAALYLLPCDFGLVCDEGDPSVWMACLRGEGCHASRAAQVTAQQAGGDATRYAATEALRDRLRDAIQSGAVARFARPNSASRPGSTISIQ